jgi:hypothetical protein
MRQKNEEKGFRKDQRREIKREKEQTIGLKRKEYRERKERERFLKDKLLMSRIEKRQERDWVKDRKDRRRKT